MLNILELVAVLIVWLFIFLREKYLLLMQEWLFGYLQLQFR